MTFSSDLRRIANQTEEKAEKLIRGTTLALFSQVIQRTPVDTGRLRGNWQTDVNKPKAGSIERLDKSGAQAINEAQNNTRNVHVGDSIFLVNNLPYAQVIEDGSSDQAPAGMVKITVNEFHREINKQARKL